MTAKNLRDSLETTKLRSEHNQDLIRRMRNGESLTSFDSQSSWFPPRPTIEKDPEAIAKLYGKKARPVVAQESLEPESSDKQVIKLVR